MYRSNSELKVINSLKERYYPVNLNGREILGVSDGFFQNNQKVTELVANELGAWVADINPFGFVDLYAGVGTFGLLVADKVTQLITVEEKEYWKMIMFSMLATSYKLAPAHGFFE